MQRRVSLLLKTAILGRKRVDDGVRSCLSTKVMHSWAPGYVTARPELRSARQLDVCIQLPSVQPYLSTSAFCSLPTQIVEQSALSDDDNNTGWAKKTGPFLKVYNFFI